MNTVLYFSTNGPVYETRAYTPADITDLIHGQRLQCLTSTDRQFDFWFSPTSRRCQRRINRKATELLLATTTFTAKTVPLLRGSIVLASHDADGDLDGLSWLQLDQLSGLNRTLTARDERILNRRIMREERRLRGETAAAKARRAAAATPATANAGTGLRWSGLAAPAQ
ncbi:hypothetical protein [Mycolicibacterium sp. NCC-Tsukiji]|uniref:hypothetical protein n=1 Tax=Mycolicibacterium sp. NCC-Tsukiji TaxID=2185272 RepID=UPI000EC33FF0|nr:hypothetical protein [Mycolicibacterium sp. NCC-Tsukiji]GCB00797.1 hypothetical protein NCCNTM_44310 [Mycolicibacterium sp. NCC-Tsukiji]